MRIAWLEMWSGLSGDMFVGALLDAGWPEERLRAGVEALGLGPFSLQVERRRHRGLTGLGIRVEAPSDPPHRHYRDIVSMLERSMLPEPVRKRALEAFRLIGEAEARVHGATLDRVHFHEIGAYDSIVDLVASVLGAHELGLERIEAGPAPIGRGEIEIGHGRVPVPAPATALLLEGWPVRATQDEGEFLTPTAAALLRVLAVPVTSPSPMRVDRVGYGAGTREHPRLPNLVRLWTGEAEDPAAEEPLAPGGSVVVLETQLDDMDPRFLSALAERLLREGALDVYRTPILMKKGRMGTLLSVVCRPADAEALGARILAQSTTLGLRVRAERRRELPRRLTAETTAFGTVRIKWADHGGRVVPSPEYEDLLRIAESTGLPLEEIRLRILRDLLPSAE